MNLLCVILGLACAVDEPATMPVLAPQPMAAMPMANKMAVPAMTVPTMAKAVAFPEECSAQPPANLQRHYLQAARRYYDGATSCELAKQGKAESNFDVNAVSPAGAIGVSQFLPATAAEFGVDPRDARSSIFGQARYLRWTRERWTPGLGGRTDDDIKALGLSSYNAGVGAMRRNQARNGWILYRQAKPHLPRETRRYVEKIEGF